MAGQDEHSRGGVSGALRPGALSALLQEIAAAPASTGEGWDPGLRPGAVVGRFELIRELGRGGFGVVWEARDRELGRAVAFKAVRAGGKAGLREERLMREAEAAARLSHPNIVTLFDVGRAEQGPYLVLELLRGKTLAERLSQGALPVPEALRIAVEVAKGLAHAHGQGVVHRDLKPENVFLCEDGQVKVLDFGLAHAFGRRRQEGGTSGYMAPEQQEGAPEDERTDVWALGAILFEMLAGRRPFVDGKAAGRAPALEVPGVPALGDLAARMVAARPVDRPRDGADVLAALVAIQREPDVAPPAGPVRTRRRPRRQFLALLVVGLAVGAALGIAIALRRPTTAVPAVASIAVLPFADLSPQGDQEYLSDGIAEEILDELSRVEGLRVAGRTSSFYFKGRSGDFREIGERLRVASVLEGSVRRSAERIRVTVRLVNVADGYRAWSESYDRAAEDLFAVQDEIARAVAQALRVKLLAGGAAARRSAPVVQEAYDQYLLGRDLARTESPANVRRALAAFEKAVSLDPGFAPAWVGIADALRFIEGLSGSGTAPQPRRALEAAERAIALAPELADGYRSRAWLRSAFLMDWAGAQGDLKRALALSPGDSRALALRGDLLVVMGRYHEAIAPLLTATDNDPLSARAWIYLGKAYLSAGDPERSRAALTRALEIAPTADEARSYLWTGLVAGGQPAAALAAAERAEMAWLRLPGVALAQHDLGRPRESQRALDAVIASNGEDAAYQIAEVFAWRGERQLAFEWLQRAFRQRDPGLRWLKGDPLLAKLRADERYGALLRKMKLPVD